MLYPEYIQREYVHSVSDAFCVLSKMTSEQPENVNIQKALDFTEQPWKFYLLTTTPSRLIPSFFLISTQITKMYESKKYISLFININVGRFVSVFFSFLRLPLDVARDVPHSFSRALLLIQKNSIVYTGCSKIVYCLFNKIL